MRPASPSEERVVRALRQANAITADQSRATLDILEATEPCDHCNATGIDPITAWETAPEPVCPKCEGTGQMRTLR